MFSKRRGEVGLMKKDTGGFSIGIVIPITLIVLTLIALILMNQAHA
jgi:tetrahydromethanopterin S-methyltransferase subunit F